MSVLWLVCARGGSKGVPGKNSRIIAGRTLIEWKVSGARPAMGEDDYMMISTDSQELADIAAGCGVNVPFIRPAELATDTAPSSAVIDHAMTWVKQHGYVFDVVMLLEPSSPFTRTEDYRQALAMIAKGADAVIGMKIVEPNTAFVTQRRADGCIANLASQIATMERGRRQDFAEEWSPSAGVYAFRWAMFERTKSVYGSYKTYGLLQEWPYCIEIDTPTDLAVAEMAAEKGLV